MAILVTGCDGYLGNVLVPLLKNSFPELYLVDLGIFNTGNEDYEKLDLSSVKYNRLFSRGKIDTVVHLAGISNDPSSELDPLLTHKMNVEASKRLIEFSSAHGVKHFIFASSASVYGFIEGSATINSPLNPLSAYAKSKVEIEEYLKNKPEMDSTIFRFGTLCGTSPKMRFDLAVNLMVKNALQDGVINIYGGGEQYRPFLDVHDAARIIVNSVHEKRVKAPINGIFNVVTTNIQIKYLAEIVSSLTNTRIMVHDVDVPDRRSYRLDPGITTKLFPKNKYTLEETVVELIKAIKDGDYTPDKVDYYTIQAWKEWLKRQ